MTDLIDLAHDHGSNPWLDAADLSAVESTFVAAWNPPVDYSEHPERWLDAVLGEYAWGLQREVWRSVASNRYTAVHSCHDSGKLLKLDEPLPTPTGWTLNGDVQVGDELLDQDGQPTRVTALSEIQTRPSYRVIFDDGTAVDCGDQHQWQVLDLTTRPRGVRDWREHWDRSVTMTAEQLHKAGALTSGGQRRWRIPVARSLQLPSANLPLDPYLLGVWLADGTTTTGQVTLNQSTKRGVAERLLALWPSMRVQPSSVGEDKASYRLPGLTGVLREMGVLGAKHVPMAYLRASAEQRLLLLQGLMDGDGFRMDGQGQSVGVDLTDERLSDDLCELVVSLGWKIRRNVDPARYKLDGVWHDTGVRYRMNWRPDVDVFLMRDPRPVLDVAGASAHTQRTIVSIEHVEPVPMRCLTVDSPRHLFLAGKSMVPTHNSFIASRIVSWWIATHPAQDAFVVTTAPTAAQVSAILWREIGKAWRKARDRGNPLPGRIVSSPFAQWKIGDQLVGFGRKPADYEQSAFQGIHERYVLVVLDEAGGIVRTLWDAVDSLATNAEARVLAIGNPDDPAAHFASICKPGSDWNVIRIDGLRTPNFTEDLTQGFPLTRALMEHEGIPYNTEDTVPAGIRSLLLGPIWVEERIRRWAGVPKDAHEKMTPGDLGDYVARKCEASALFTAKVRGLFPDGGTKGVIPLGWIERAVERWHDWDRGDQKAGIEPRRVMYGRRVVGVDVAGEGDDQTAAAVRNHYAITELHRYVEADTMATADMVVEHLANIPQALAVVDVIGLGAGVRDKLRRDGVATVGFNASAQSGRKDRFGEFEFLNDRAAAWWNLRELLDPSQIGGSQLMLPDDEQLKMELTAPTWKVRVGGKIQIEAKDEIRKRLGHSTDSADAVVMAFWTGASPVNGWDDDDPALAWGNTSAPQAVIRYPTGSVGSRPGDDWENFD